MLPTNNLLETNLKFQQTRWKDTQEEIEDLLIGLFEDEDTAESLEQEAMQESVVRPLPDDPTLPF